MRPKGLREKEKLGERERKTRDGSRERLAVRRANDHSLPNSKLSRASNAASFQSSVQSDTAPGIDYSPKRRPPLARFHLKLFVELPFGRGATILIAPTLAGKSCGRG